MKDAVIRDITKGRSRKSLYHFTRVSNLPAIAHYDALLSSARIDSYDTGQRRTTVKVVNVDGLSVTINAHLRIPDSMMEVGVTQERFRTCLDRHVFLWPTLRDCRTMLDMYTRREPEEPFAVLEFDAYSLLFEHYSAAKLSKYDSGSAPRYPARCSYKKSPDMFLPIDEFKKAMTNLVPVQASEIREILIEDRVSGLSNHLRAVYVNHRDAVPERWRHLAKPQSDLQA